MNAILEEISKLGIVPVVAIDDAKDASALAKALCAGGLPVAEVTFRTSAAEEAIKIMSTEFPEMLIGAGTVLTREQVDKAINAGAKFIVSPGLNPDIVSYCIERNIPMAPGCSSPSDIEIALSLGLDVVKFFPAEAAGGLKMIKAMSGPYGNLKFMPTGGINADNLCSYLDFKKIIACGGSWMVSKELVKEGKFDEIEALTREAVTNMLGFKLAHIGINETSDKNALALAETFAKMFGFATKNGNSSVFAGTAVEIMKTPYLGTKGHIAISTNYLDRAMYHLEKRGFEFDENALKYNADGKLVAAYFKGEFGGFAIHLVQK